MKTQVSVIKMKKRYPFTISRGTRTHSSNVFIEVSDGKYRGIGECDAGDETEALTLKNSLQQFCDSIDDRLHAISDVEKLARERGLSSPAQAALNIARWDLFARQCNKPLYEIFGINTISVPTSITLGMIDLDLIADRVAEILHGNRFRFLKIKLGSPLGIERDQQAFSLIKEAAHPFNVGLRVDANGGWSLRDAQKMFAFLASQNVDYIEQPLHADDINNLPELFRNRLLPIFVDESCHVAADIPALASCVDGINIKLMKCGGLSEALRMIAVARTFRLQTMIGCMSESSIAISAASQIGSLFDHIDLDSHINLDPDPAQGSRLENGVIVPNNLPGHGAQLC